MILVEDATIATQRYPMVLAARMCSMSRTTTLRANDRLWVPRSRPVSIRRLQTENRVSLHVNGQRGFWDGALKFLFCLAIGLRHTLEVCSYEDVIVIVIIITVSFIKNRCDVYWLDCRAGGLA